MKQLPEKEIQRINDLVDRGWGSRTTLWRLIKAGKIPASRVGRTYIIKSKDFELFLERTRIPPTAPNF